VLGIYDISTQKIITNQKLLEVDILQIAFKKSNSNAFISDKIGNIKQIIRQNKANSINEFDLTQESFRLGNSSKCAICLTHDDINLLVGSDNKLSIFNT